MPNTFKNAEFPIVTGTDFLLSTKAFAQSVPIDLGHLGINQVETQIDDHNARLRPGVSDGWIKANPWNGVRLAWRGVSATSTGTPS